MDSVRTGYDVAIIGSGIAGSSLALVLARQGMRATRNRAFEHEPLCEVSRTEDGAFHKAYDVFRALTVGAVQGKLADSEILRWGGLPSTPR